ncbi:transposable element Tcb2 transposase [Trichonephila clavipes]|nr:transposable element Tcb2 transposase [Trichonephila clavipes]
MDDNVRPHRTLAVEELLESEDITRMDWPAYFPDLNPIEHVCDVLGRRIAARLHHPENTQQLKQMLVEEWTLLQQEMLHQLVLSTRRRYEATIAFFFDKGENTSQVTEVSNGIYRANSVTVNYVQSLFRRFRSGIFDVKDAPRTCRPDVENADKITEIIEVDRFVSSRSIIQGLKIDHKTVLSYLRKVELKK